MDRYRLQRLAQRKIEQEKPKHSCAKCGHEALVFDFSRPVTTKTCKNSECKAVELISHVKKTRKSVHVLKTCRKNGDFWI